MEVVCKKVKGVEVDDEGDSTGKGVFEGLDEEVVRFFEPEFFKQELPPFPFSYSVYYDYHFIQLTVYGTSNIVSLRNRQGGLGFYLWGKRGNWKIGSFLYRLS